MKHSELPWTIEPCASGGGLICKGTSRSAQSHIQIYPMADAQFIVKACNSHYKLLELLKVAACPNCDGSGAYYDGHGEVCQCQFCYEREQAIKEAE